MTPPADSELAQLRTQGEHLVRWFAGAPADAFARRTVLPEWDLRELLAHLVLVYRGAARGLSRPTSERAVPAADYVVRYRRDVAQIAASTAQTAADHRPEELVDALGKAVGALPADTGGARTVVGGRGPISARDWVRTRIVDVVVHCDDLNRSVDELAPAGIDRSALATAVRTLAEIFAAQAPGRSVELRIPPLVAVQAVSGGPRHTRGTPPNVVETDAITWLRVATGRVTFTEAAASGALRASGNRADLTPYLPVLS